MIWNFIKKYKFWLIVTFIFLLLRLPSLFEPYWYGDEGIYLVLGKAIRHGWVLYRQIHDNKPPTLYYLAAISQTVFGFRLLLMLWMVPTIYIFHLISKNFYSSTLSKLSTLVFLFLTSIPLFEGNIANAEIFMLLPTLLAVYIFFKYKSHYSLLLVGLLLGISFSIKVPVVFELVALCFYLLITNFSFKKIKFLISSYLLLIIGFILPIALWAVYFYFHQAISEFTFAALLQNFGYLSSWATGSHSGSATSSGLISRGLILLAGWLLICLLYFFKKINQKTVFTTLWLSSTIFASLLSTRPYPHYLIFTFPSLCLCIFYFFSQTNFLEKTLSVVFIAVLVFSFFHYKFYVYPVFSYYSNIYNFVIGQKSVEEYRQYFGSEMNQIYQLSDWLKSNTKSDETLFIWSDQPDVYALADRLPVGRFTVAYHVVDFQQYDYIMNQLEIYTPNIIVFYSNYPHQFPQLEKFLSLFYFPDHAIGQAIIFRRH